MRGVRVFLLVFGACALVAALAAPFAIRELRELGSGLSADAAREQQEVLAFALAHEQSECAPESLRRAAGCGGLMCAVAAPVFMKKCLQNARHSPALCEEIPKTFLDAVSWPARRCAGEEAELQICQRIYLDLVEFCAERTRSQRPPPRQRELHGTPSPSPSS